MTNTKQETKSIQKGTAVIERFLKTLSPKAGVYRMLDDEGRVLYVGKASNLKSRVQNYTSAHKQSIRIQRMISRTASMQVVETNSEADALLLEADLIKSLKPYYNVLLKDDKSYPEILITRNDNYPLIKKHRGRRTIKGEYFGPFANAGAVNETITFLQKTFMLRTCTDSQFKNRTRPCLQYQIKRCSAPCIDGSITNDQYTKSAIQAVNFLKGKDKTLGKILVEEMHSAAEKLDFETAKIYRDRIASIKTTTTTGGVQMSLDKDADIIAVCLVDFTACVQMFFYRGGRSYGTKSFFPVISPFATKSEIISSFVSQFYSKHPPPSLIFVNEKLNSQDDLISALEQIASKRITIKIPQKGEVKRIMDLTFSNANSELNRKRSFESSNKKNLDELARLLNLRAAPNRIEVYDNSHNQGSNPIGAMIVVGGEGFDKKSYRKWNITTTMTQSATTEQQQSTYQDNSLALAGDDFAMMKEVFTRRFKRALTENSVLPDVIVIDGGKGHLSVVKKSLKELQETLFSFQNTNDFSQKDISNIAIICIAKGVHRNSGRETFFDKDANALHIPPSSPLRYYLQVIRDEAHRFAIGGHRKQRNKALFKNPLDEIEGIGSIRRKALLNAFGSARAVGRASALELKKVPTISSQVAEKIYNHFNE